MIKHIRNPEPPFLKTFTIQNLKSSDELFYSEEIGLREQKRSRTQEENIGVEEEILLALEDEFNGKCAFCDQNTEREDLVPTIHRFRPRRLAKNLNNEISSDHYHWYAYEWKNLYLACRNCNEHKSAYFPVASQRAGKATPIEKVDEVEERVFIDPCIDDPEEFFFYENDGSIRSNNQYGQVTINLFKLNRIHLRNRRKSIITNSLKNISFKTSINTENFKTNAEFLGLRRYLVKKAIIDDPDLLEIIPKDGFERLFNPSSFVDINQIGLKDSAEIPVKKPPLKKQEAFPPIDRTIEFVELHSIDIHHFKNITDLHFEFPKDTSLQTSWSFFLGENGSGKSSIIQAITLALVGDKVRKKLKLNPKEFLQQGKRKCTVKLETNQGTYNLVIRPKGIEGTRDATSTFVLGYGSTRLMATINGIKEQDHTNRIKVGNLFSPTMGLVDAKKWLLSLDRDTFNLVSVALKEVLDLTKKQLEKDREGKIIRKRGQIFFNEPGKPSMELATLSDGYKILIAMVCDICRSINEVLSNKEKNHVFPHNDFEEIHGIIIIDELGTHLHPRWKMRIVTALRTAFKRMRFIVSSHEPLCLRGLNEGEVMVVEYEDFNVNMLDGLPDPSKYRLDQILTSPFFGLYSVIDPVEGETFHKYYRLLRKGRDLTAEESNELAQLSKDVRQYNIMGNTLREELAYYAVDKLLADQQNKNKVKWSELNDHAVRAVEKLWTTYENDL